MYIERDQVRTLLLLAGLAVVFVTALWLPLHWREAVLRQRIMQAQAQVQRERGGAVTLAVLRQEITNLKATLGQAPKQVPPESELAGLLRQISTLLATHQVADQQVLTQQIIQGSDYSVLPMTLEFKGSFPTMFGFLKDLEAMPRLVRVTRLDLHGDPRKPGTPLNATLDLWAFFATAQESQR